MATFAGGKFTKSHTTAIEVSKKVVKAAEKLSQVQKISLGYINGQSGGSKRRIKFSETDSGLLMKVVGPTGGQEIYLYCDQSDRDEVQKALRKVWDKN